MEKTMIKVLIVEDSVVSRELLIHILTSDPEIRIVGVARDGQEAIEAVKILKPDIITMDIHMPGIDGFEATRQIMANNPTPIIIVTGSLVSFEIYLAFEAIKAGALAVLHRPPGIGSPEHEIAVKELLQTVKLMSEIKVVTRKGYPTKSPQLTFYPSVSSLMPFPEIRLVVIGTSTGGPQALQKILVGLPRDFFLPIIIVQHIACGFLPGFVQWLSGVCPLPMHIAAHGEIALPGHVFVAPDGFHLGIDSHLQIILSESALENGVRPSVSYLFRSVDKALGANAVGVLLTGMGRDGSQELKLMRDSGAITIAQDEESSVVFGMPGEAIKLGAATYILSPEKIAVMLAQLDRAREGIKP